MRVGILSLIHESNTFLPTPTTIDLFRRDFLLTGDAIRRAREGGNHEISAFFKGLDERGVEAVPMFFASTWPSGAITLETCRTLMDMLFEQVDQAGPVDGFLIAAHGANAGEGDQFRDLDGYWLTRLREKVGPRIPIIVVVDAHANMSPAMIQATTATIGYRTNPHLDQIKCGLEAVDLMIRAIKGEIHPTQGAAFPPVAINIERQNTTEPHFRGLFALADRQLKEPGVLSNSVVLGFPYTDVEKMGTSFIVVTDDNPQLAQRLADELADYLIEHRHEFVGQYMTIEEAVDTAIRLPGPVGLLDMGDNVGGGAAADGTLLAAELNRRKVVSFVCIYDPEAQEQALGAGIGNRVRLNLGGKTDKLHGPPLDIEVVVRGVHDGKYHEKGVVHGGHSNLNFGTLVTVVADSGLTICISSRRVVPISIGLVTCCGLDPRAFQVIAAKGVQSPVPALGPVCTRLIRVDSPGATPANMTRLSYTHRRRPLFPFEELSTI